MVWGMRSVPEFGERRLYLRCRPSCVPEPQCPALCLLILVQGNQLVLLARDFPRTPGPLRSQTQGPSGSPSLAWLPGGEPRAPGRTTAPSRQSLPVRLQPQTPPTVTQRLPAAEGPLQTGRSSSGPLSLWVWDWEPHPWRPAQQLVQTPPPPSPLPSAAEAPARPRPARGSPGPGSGPWVTSLQATSSQAVSFVHRRIWSEASGALQADFSFSVSLFSKKGEPDFPRALGSLSSSCSNPNRDLGPG